jgi:hypothetical protein
MNNTQNVSRQIKIQYYYAHGKSESPFDQHNSHVESKMRRQKAKTV